MVRLQLILFSKITCIFVPTFGPTQIYCLTGAIISETRITKTNIFKYYDTILDNMFRGLS
jgi:hypothetical protein